MAGADEILREGVRANLSGLVSKLSCDGDIERQHFFKKKFIQKLKTSPIAIETDKANEQHYEVPTDFFKLALGKRLKYSSCVWPEGVTSLDEAEQFTLRLYCERAGIQDGHSVMDLGCGWGSVGLFVLENFPKCHVTCVSNSATQREYIVSRAKELGADRRLNAVTADANVYTTSQQFDRIVSIEMFEHMKNYQSLFERVSSWLTPQGRLFIQILCHRHFPYSFDARKGSDTEWMARNFFSGGTMPSHDLFLHFQKDVSLLDSWIVNGCHYSRTLEAWLCNTDRNKVQIQDLFNSVYGKEAEQKLFNWRLFFIFCSEVFGYSEGNEWHVSHYLFQKKITKSLL